MSETSDIVGPTMKALAKIPGVYALRLQSGRRGRVQMCPAGTPDILVITRGKAAFLEAKLPGEKFSEPQVSAMFWIERAGSEVYEVNSVSDSLKIVKQLLKAG